MFVPLFILSIITYQVLVDVEPRSAKMSVNDGTQRSHAPYGPSVPFTVPLGGLRAATITLHVGENAPTKFSLGRWKVLLYSLQATKLGRHFGFAPLPLRFCYKIPITDAKGGSLRVEGIPADGREIGECGYPKEYTVGLEPDEVELLKGSYDFYLTKGQQSCRKKQVDVDEDGIKVDGDWQKFVSFSKCR